MLYDDPIHYYDQEDSDEWRTLIVDRASAETAHPWTNILADRRCSTCFGRLEREWDYDSGVWRIVCIHACLPEGGHVSAEYVRHVWAHEEEWCEEVRNNYPEIAERDPRVAEWR
jgi:hypothetical protein